MNDTITVVGNLATPPETKHLPDGTPVTSFRLASS
ncbi:MAG TPA: single-stranded DNA-binding protein, partial [Microbacterium sp.]|nr:single-stranded DNA-binding protein [Microbacterium sp.]